ncbi:MFS transporter [Arthroderma uncinatum]|uniref:MFS transporter n=1 Tax=Arthroderma uncinatum TaxID=74035 RepID=UPI00144AF840|nr:MFS transporter [Arthroderma uncinatum]KAF3491955.1 MFS transporter [Arthroderma uncinatum]
MDDCKAILPDGVLRENGIESASHNSHGNNCETTLEDGEGQVADNAVVQVVDHKAERALCSKLDIQLLPVLAVMYLFNALDKGNIGNAQTNGLSKDLNLASGEYNLLLSIFFIPYVLFAPPIAMLGKKYSPARVLPICMFSFGSLTLLSATTYNFSGLFALRWLLGMSESAFLPLVIYYLTTFYRRGELARRLAIFYAASNIANAFSGLLAFGVFQIPNSKLQGWRYLFLIEGACTVCFSAFAFWYLPRTSAEARFLNAQEKALAFHRIQVDSSSVVNEKFSFREAVEIFRQPTSYCFISIEICLGVPLQSVALFLPQIIQRLGYETVKTNLYTVAPNCTGAAMLLILAFISDATRLRSPFIVLGFLLTFSGFMIYASIDNVEQHIRLAYFGAFMMTWGTSAPSVLLSTWYNNNVAHEGRRVLLTSVGVPLANLMGLVSSNIFREKDKPKYQPALITTGIFGGVGACIAAGLGLYMAWDNRRRNRRAGVKTSASDVPTKRLRDGPEVEEFRWFI